MKQFFLGALDDFVSAFQRAIAEPPWPSLGALAAGFVVCWWLYVPAHELLHAFGCLATGGSVDRLEIDPWYGAALLQQFFPFVAVGSKYAGQLTGFDTYGNDLTYLATVFAPFLLTIFIGVPLLYGLRNAKRPGPLPSFLVGVSIPLALTPFTNVHGDYYEMGSIVVSRLARLLNPDLALDRWRSDDLFKTAGELLFQGSFQFYDLLGLTLGTLLGLLLAFATYWVGRVLARALLGR